MVTGEYEQSKKELQSLQKKLQQVEAQCEALMRMGNEDGAIIKAQERQEILEDIQHTGDMMDKYEQAMNEAKEKGLVRAEGKDYIMKDGDIVLFRFNV